jgi:hypothetical protein
LINFGDQLKNLGVIQVLGATSIAQQYCQQALALATELGIPPVAECEALQLEIENAKIRENLLLNPEATPE